MSLSADFNEQYTATKVNDYVLQTCSNGVYMNYDFVGRMMYGWAGSHTFNTVPFAQLDRETLILMHDKLVDLGGNPPELPDSTPAAPAPGGKFKL